MQLSLEERIIICEEEKAEIKAEKKQ